MFKYVLFILAINKNNWILSTSNWERIDKLWHIFKNKHQQCLHTAIQMNYTDIVYCKRGWAHKNKGYPAWIQIHKFKNREKQSFYEGPDCSYFLEEVKRNYLE